MADNQVAVVEKALLIAAHEHDVLHVAEEGGNNRGKRVEEYLASVGLGPGNPWCASFVNWCLLKAGWKGGPSTGRGAVRYWVAWAKQWGNLITDITQVQRGDLFTWLNADGTGHTGWVCETKKKLGLWWIRTIEGNSNGEGSREGDSVVRKWRLVTSKYKFIRLS